MKTRSREGKVYEDGVVALRLVPKEVIRGIDESGFSGIEKMKGRLEGIQAGVEGEGFKAKVVDGMRAFHEFGFEGR